MSAGLQPVGLPAPGPTPAVAKQSAAGGTCAKPVLSPAAARVQTALFCIDIGAFVGLGVWTVALHGIFIFCAVMVRPLHYESIGTSKFWGVHPLFKLG